MGGRRRRAGVVAIRPEALRAARQERGLTQQEAAAGIVSAQAFAGWETGLTRPVKVHLEQVCKRLGVSVTSLLADVRDERELELTRLDGREELGRLRDLAAEMLADLNVRPASNAIARYYHGRAIVHESPQEALTELRRAYTFLTKRELLDLGAQALEWQAVALYYLEDPGALATAQRALETYRDLPERDPRIESRMHEHVATIQLQHGDVHAAAASYDEALAGAVDIGRLAVIYHGRAIADRRLGNTRRALDFMERAVHLFRARDEIRGIAADAGTARAENTLAWHLLLAGDWRRAEEMAMAAIQHFEDTGFQDGQANALLTMGELRQKQGQLDDAGAWTEHAIELAERLGAAVTVSKGYQQLGEVWALQGEEERVEAAFSRAVEVLADHPEQRSEALARYHRLTAERVKDRKHA